MNALVPAVITGGIGATVSVATLVITTFTGRRAALRVSRRDGMKPYTDELAKATWECVAIASVIAHRGRQQKAESAEWRERAIRASAQLKELRLKIRYTIAGLEEPMQTLSQVPTWALHFAADPTKADALVSKSTNLRRALDRCVVRVSIEGLPPTRRQVKRAVSAGLEVERLFRPTNPPAGNPRS